jgi:tyrocidine synthetase-3
LKDSYIGIIVDDSPELLTGLLGILKSGNTFVPINPVFPDERVHFIIHDCKIKVLLTDNANYEKAQQIVKDNPLIRHLMLLNNQVQDQNPNLIAEDTRESIHSLDSDAYCYVIYTSGSTGRPKGVPITHRNLLPLFSWFRDYFGLGEHTRVMQNLSYTFDFGVFELLTTLIFGGRLYVIHRHQKGDLGLLVDFINSRSINTIHTTPAFFSHVAAVNRKMPSLDLVHFGGERLTGKIISDVAGLASEKCHIYNGYGPTEATINCSIFSAFSPGGDAQQRERIRDRENIPIGRPSANNSIYILDTYNRLQPPGAAGELCVAGEGLARGYLNRPELTAERFDQDFQDDQDDQDEKGPAARETYRDKEKGIDKNLLTPLPLYPSTPLYRTGDLARWLSDGNIEFLGRIDHQVKVRGFRIELGEIEHCLLTHEEIKDAAVLAREKEDGSHYLCAYFVPGNSHDGSIEHAHAFTVSELREYLLQQLPDYMIPSYFVQLDRMPLTTNGKIDRKVLPEPDESTIATGKEYVPPMTGTEKHLVKTWQEILKIETIGITDDFFELGGDSLLANQCIARVRKELQVEVALRKFFEQPFIKALAREIEGREKKRLTIEKAARDGHIPLSFAQERLWFLQELDADSAAYFVPRVIRMKGKMRQALLERTFTEIIRRHEILRTVFPTVDGRPIQRIQPPYPFEIPVIDWSKEEEAAQNQKVSRFLTGEGKRPFDFEKGPLLRVTLLKLKEEEHLLVLTEHHLIHDGWTQGVLLREFIEIFTAYSEKKEQPLPELPIQYADYAIWQRHYLQGEVLELHLEYWKEKLSGLDPVLELPADRPRPAVISGQGALKVFHLPEALTKQLKDFSRRNGVTLFMTMLAVFKTFLYRYTGVEDLCVGTGIANRRYQEMEGMLGMLINTLPLRTQVGSDIPFDRCLFRVKETCLEAYQHEDTPLGKIVEVLQPERSLSYSPLFQVAFSFMDTPSEDLRLPGLDLQLEDTHNRSSKFDINIVVVPPEDEREEPTEDTEGSGETLVEWEYNTDIFDDETADRMITHYTRLLEEILHTPGKKLSALPMLPGSEIHRLLYVFNDTSSGYPKDKTIHRLFEEQAERTGDKIAVIGMGHAVTYRELNQKSNRLARVLMEKGVRSDTIVGIMMERTVELIVGILGILKAGGAYLPIDPGYPEERTRYMLADSGTRVLLTGLLEKHHFNCQLSIVNYQLSMSTASPSLTHLTHLTRPTHLCYIIYTSGTTGRPKGTMIRHRSLVNLCYWHIDYYRLTGKDNVTQYAGVGFDASVWEIFPGLVVGAALHIIEPGIRLDIGELNDYFEKNRITVSFLPTPVCHQFMDRDNHSLRKLLTGGDKLQRFIKRSYDLYNNYGPTENTVVTTTYPVESLKENIPIGTPIANTCVYILCKGSPGLQPIGVPGELCIAGDGLSMGYLNRPELTADKFDRDLQDLQDYQDERGIDKKTLTPLPLYLSTPLYRTGDLARWLPGGTIEFMGRVDQQVKIRGFRIELGEITNQLLSHKAVKEAVVVTGEDENQSQKYLCAYIVPKDFNAFDESVLGRYLSLRLPAYMIPACFVTVESIPLTPNGKVDKDKLPMPRFNLNAAQYTPPRDEIEEKLVEIWAGVLNIDGGNTLHAPLGIDDNFFDRGGHSLKATLLVSRIHKAFKVKIPLTDVFQNPTIRALSRCILNTTRGMYDDIKPAPLKEYYPQSSTQQRLFFLDRFENIGTSYNMPMVHQIEGNLDHERLETAFNRLVQRHETLRTSFDLMDEKPVQKIHHHVDFEIREIPIHKRDKDKPVKEEEIKEKIDAFMQPFDLGCVPLFRVGRITLSDTKCLLLFDMHHIISDGTSQEIFTRELLVLYAGDEALPELSIQYKDFSEWQSSDTVKKQVKEQETYWLKEFAGEIPVLNLPLDYPRPTVQGFEGGAAVFDLEKEETHRLNRLFGTRETTLFMVLLAIGNIFLSKLTGQDDIIVGIPIAGRRHADLEPIIGMFVNTLALRNFPHGEKTLHGFLNEVKEKTLKAYENQEYPLEDLVEQVSVHRDMSRNPLFDVMIVLRNQLEPTDRWETMEFAQLKLTPYEYERTTAKFDMIFHIIETEEQLHFKLEYSTALFKPETIGRYINYFKTVVKSVIQDPDQRIAGINIISGEEKRQVLLDFNDTETLYPRDKTIHELFEEQAERAGHKIALVGRSYHVGTNGRFIASGTRTPHLHITYPELNETSNRLSHLLMEKGVQPGSIVGIMGERSVEMIIGILGILKAGGAYLPIDADYPEQRKQYMLADSHADVLVTAGSTAESMSVDVHIDSCREQFGRDESAIRPYMKHAGNISYIMYTSGSTGRPKGVMVTHRNVVRLVKNTNYVALGEETRILQTGAPVFDATTFEIWGSLLNGGQLVLVDKDVILDAHRLGEALKEFSINTLWLSAPLFNQLMQQNIELFAPLNYLLVGGDVLSPPHINRVKRKFPGLNIINGYGPTENTTFSTTYLIENEFEHAIPIGAPIANSTTYIVDNHHQLQPIGVWGELIVGGDGVSQGYLNSPEMTADRFNRSYMSYMTYISYSTGDLARWLPDGTIEFKGRMDQQVKIRGFRIEPEEIENRLLKHPGIKEAAVTVWDDGRGDHYLCAYIVPRYSAAADASKTFSASELTGCLEKELPGFMIPSHFVELPALPLNLNGKLDRKALPEPDAAVPGDYVGPGNPLQEHLATIWSDVLNIEKNRIGIDSNFFEIGGHSLKATVLLSKIHKEMNVKVHLADIFKFATIRQLAAYVESIKQKQAHEQERFISIKTVEKREYYDLSPAQKRLYILQQMEAVYNITAAWEIKGLLNRKQLEETLNQLILQHESLRTSFGMINDIPFQKIHDHVDFKVEYYDLSRDKVEEERDLSYAFASSSMLPAGTIESFIRPFDLTRVPLMRVGLIEIEEDYRLLVLDMHHIISDGTSLGIFIKEFMRVYSGGCLPPLRLQYKDYSRWHKRECEGETIKKQEDYWMQQFDTEIPLLNLPYDYHRPAVQSYEGRTLVFRLGKEEMEVLKGFAVSEDASATLYMVLLALFYVLLAKLSGNDDITVGTPIAGRRHIDLQPIIGMFVGTLTLRNYPDPSRTFSEFLREVKERTLTAFENQDYQFEDLVEHAAVNRDPGRNPLFDVMFALQNMEVLEMEISDLNVRLYEFENKIANFDLFLQGYEKEEEIIFWFTYCTKLFKKETVERFISYFKKIMAVLIRNPHKKISGIEIISDREKQHILADFNNTWRDYPRDKTIHELFEAQVERAGDKIALVGSSYHVGMRFIASGTRTPHLHITYPELNETSNRLARRLMEKGVRPGSIVGIMGERSVEMIIGILGILKAGGAYLPIDADYPEQRKQYMLADSKAEILLNTHHLSRMFSFEKEGIHHSSDQFIIHHSDNLAYIMYTSGSTGRPKGVMVTHQNVVRLVKNTNYVALGEETRILQTGAPVFDATTFEIWGSLLNGGQLVLVDKEVILDAHRLGSALIEHCIDTLWLSAPLFNQLMQQNIEMFAPLNYLLVGGDVLSPTHINRVKQEFPGLDIINGYGPTENTTFSTTYLIENEFEHAIPIGAPIANSTTYIVDNHHRLQPIGVWGELVVGGDGVSRGYLNSPEMTANHFNRSYMSYGSDISYSTGDLARWLPDGNIDFLGRTDQQVKLRGFRIELEEIENQLLKHEEVREAVVMAKTGDPGSGDKYLCAYIVPHSSFNDETSLREFLSMRLPDYMVPDYFVILEKIPLNPNGKIDRRALPEPEIGKSGIYTPPRDAVEEKLVRIWADVLGIEKDILGIDNPFFQLGGHSLKATMLVSKIHKAFDVKVPLMEIFKLQTIRSLSEWIKRAQKTAFIDIEPVEKRACYELSYNQKRLWIIRQLTPGDTSYNIPGVLTLEHDVDVEVVKKSLASVTMRYESLRTAFKEKEGEPVQFIEENVKIPLEIIDISSLGEEDKQHRREGILREESQTPFDLTHPPLFRTILVKCRDDCWDFVFNMHHIISDGWSHEIMKRDFKRYYEIYNAGGETAFEPLRVQYKDFAAWHNRQLENPRLKETAHRFWLHKLEDGLSGFHFPYDFSDYKDDATGARYRTVVDNDIKERLKNTAADNNTTLFIVMFSAYNWLLSLYSGQKEIVCSIISAGREHEALQGIVGFFINSLASKIKVDSEERFEDFLPRVDREIMELFQHQGYPLELVLDDLKMPFPGIDVSFNMLNMQQESTEAELESFESLHVEDMWDVKFGLALHVIEYKNGIEINWSYKKALFNPATITLISGGYLELLNAVTGNPKEKEEKQQ